MRYLSLLNQKGSEYKEKELPLPLKKEIQRLQYRTVQLLKSRTIKKEKQSLEQLLKIIKNFNETIENML